MPLRVVSEGCLFGLPRGGDQAGVEGVLGDIDPDDGGCGIGAHGVPPLWLTDAGSCPEWGGPVIASEVEERRWSVRNLVLEVGPRPLHAVDPTTGPRSRKDRMLTCEALQQTAGARRLSRVHSSSSPRRC